MALFWLACSHLMTSLYLHLQPTPKYRTAEHADKDAPHMVKPSPNHPPLHSKTGLNSVEGIGISNGTCLVHSLIHITNHNEEASFSVESQCFLTNCQSMQEMSAPESTNVEKLTTFNMYKRVINWTGILIDLFKVDTNTEAYNTREGELYIETSLPFKNPYPTQRIPKPLFHLHLHLQFL